MVTFKNGSQISPCIVSKAKFALGLKITKPENNKICSTEYWNKVVCRIAELKAVEDDKIEKAQAMYNTLVL